MLWYISRLRGRSKSQGGEAHENQRTQQASRNDRRRHQGATTAHVRIDLGGGAVVTASITNEAVDELKLKKGEKAYAVIKATDVMVGLD
jgi:molybdopterin-binding protein